MKEKNKIPAVFKEDLNKLLTSINEIEPIENGERICQACFKIITLENIQLIIPRSGGVFHYVCNSPVCIEDYNTTKDIKK